MYFIFHANIGTIQACPGQWRGRNVRLSERMTHHPSLHRSNSACAHQDRIHLHRICGAAAANLQLQNLTHQPLPPMPLHLAVSTST